MKKIKDNIVRFIRNATTSLMVVLILSVFVTKTLLTKLALRRSTDFSEDKIGRIESLIDHDLRNPTGFYLYTFIIKQLSKNRAFHEGDICAFITIASFELNLTNSEKVYLCMKHTKYSKYITLKFRQ